MRTKFHWLKPSSFWYFVPEASANKYSDHVTVCCQHNFMLTRPSAPQGWGPCLYWPCSYLHLFPQCLVSIRHSTEFGRTEEEWVHLIRTAALTVHWSKHQPKGSQQEASRSEPRIQPCTPQEVLSSLISVHLLSWAKKTDRWPTDIWKDAQPH